MNSIDKTKLKNNGQGVTIFSVTLLPMGLTICYNEHNDAESANEINWSLSSTVATALGMELAKESGGDYGEFVDAINAFRNGFDMIASGLKDRKLEYTE